MVSYRLTVDAEKDLDNILQYSYTEFGLSQMLIYKERIKICFTQLVDRTILCKNIALPSGEIVQFIHCQKHYIFALSQADSPLLVLGIFHQKMDLIARIEKRLKS